MSLKHFGMPREKLKEIRQKARKRRAGAWRWHEAYKRRHPFAGLQFCYKCSDGWRDIAARHWPTSLTWSWIIGFNRFCKDDHSPPSTIWPTKWRAWIPRVFSHNSGGQWSFGPLRGAWQEEMPHVRTSKTAGDKFIAGLKSPAPQEGEG